MDEPAGCTLRLAEAEDVPALAALYARCARTLGPAVYTPAQVEAWASFGQVTDEFRRYVMQAETWVAQPAGSPDGAAALPAGFCGAGRAAEMGGAAEVHSLYVDPVYSRRGLGTGLLRHVLAQARARGQGRFAAWVTPLSRPVFQRQGFRLVETLQAPYQGVMFERYRVEYP